MAKLNEIQGCEVQLEGNLNMMQITPSQLKEKLIILFEYIRKNADSLNIPIFIYGPPGVGKTEIIQSIGKELGMNVNVLIASMLDPSDIHGLPYLGKSKESDFFTTSKAESEKDKKYKDLFKNIVEWAPDKIWLKDFNKTNIYFFDEMNMARKEVLAPLYRVILEGKIGDVDISKSIRISAGNRPEDFKEIKELSLPLETRYEMYWVKPDRPSWIKWATENNNNYKNAENKDNLFYINSLVLYYIDKGNIDPDSAYPLYCAASDERRADIKATPRSWVRVSNILNAYMEKLELKDPAKLNAELNNNKKLSEEEKTKKFVENNKAIIDMIESQKLSVDISGSVGYKIAKEFIDYIKKYLNGLKYISINKKIDDAFENKIKKVK